MTIYQIPFKLTSAERVAWMRLMGTQAIPPDRAEMTRQAAATFDTRCRQSSTDIDALSILTEAAETLNVFGGKVDTQSTSMYIGKKPACMPASFRTVDGLRLDGAASTNRPSSSND